MKLPNCTKPCNNCPFRKDVMKGWLGANRMREILAQNSFTCHKTDRTLQCAGHMLIKGYDNEFFRLAKALQIPLQLSGKELIFESEEDCVLHHRFKTNNDAI